MSTLQEHLADLAKFKEKRHSHSAEWAALIVNMVSAHLDELIKLQAPQETARPSLAAPVAWVGRRLTASGEIDHETVKNGTMWLKEMGYTDTEIHPLYEAPLSPRVAPSDAHSETVNDLVLVLDVDCNKVPGSLDLEAAAATVEVFLAHRVAALSHTEQQDAGRYRWLRDDTGSLYHYVTCWTGGKGKEAENIDAAIDAHRGIAARSTPAPKQPGDYGHGFGGMQELGGPDTPPSSSATPKAWMAFDPAYMRQRIAWNQRDMDEAGPGLTWEPLYAAPVSATGERQK